MYCHVLAVRIAGEPPACRGKPRFCKKNTVKRRKEMNDERKQQTTGESWRSRIALRLKPPDALSSRLQQLQRVCRYELERRTHQIRTFYSLVAPSEGNDLAYQLKDQLVLGSSLASNTASIRGCGPLYCQYIHSKTSHLLPHCPLSIVPKSSKNVSSPREQYLGSLKESLNKTEICQIFQKALPAFANL